MTIWCERPTPSVKRPPAMACAESACCAIACGWRGKVGTTAVPSSMRRVSRAHSAAAMIASMPMMLANQPLAKPSASSRFACAMSPSTPAGAPAGKAAPPAGDPARRRAPFRGGIAGPERSLLCLAMNSSKRGLTLDLGHARGHALFLELAARADVVLETETPPGRGWPELRARNPRLVHVALTPFGETGPRAAWRGSDLTVTAMSGNLYSTGDPDRAPVRCSLPVSYY